MLRICCNNSPSFQSLIGNVLQNRLKTCSFNLIQKCSIVNDTNVRNAASTFPVGDNLGVIAERRTLPLVTSRKLSFPTNQPPKQAWLETLSTVEDEKLGLLDLHPDVFGVFPRIDIIWENIHWQSFYRKIRYDKQLNRAELKGGGRKPWPQKRSGKARAGSVRSPLFIHGGKSFGPRGPYTYFYMLPTSKRVKGLTTSLSVKFAQDNLHIVDSLDLPTDEPEYLDELIESRGWGLSVLFVNDVDVIPRNIALATDVIKPYNVVPAYGLNVYSMLKHETVVLTLSALEQIEKNLLAHLNCQDFKDYKFDKKAWNQPMHPVYDQIV